MVCHETLTAGCSKLEVDSNFGQGSIDIPLLWGLHDDMSHMHLGVIVAKQAISAFPHETCGSLDREQRQVRQSAVSQIGSINGLACA